MSAPKTSVYWFLLCALFAAAIHTILMRPTGLLEAVFLDIGQGDATLITSPSGYRILIDGGPDTSVLRQLAKHLPLLDRRIDLMVMTHPDSDHSRGLLDVIRRYDVRSVLITGIAHDTITYKTILKEIREQNIPVFLPDPRIDLRFSDGLTLDILWPQPGLYGKTVKSTNNAGVVFNAIAGNRSVLMTGDIDAVTEAKILQTGQDLRAEVLKVSHHGSKTSSAMGFLLATSPSRAVISAARQNSYGHPHKVVLDRLASLAIPVHVTAWEGEGRY